MLLCRAYLVVGHGADRRDDQLSVPRYVRAVVPKVGVLDTSNKEVRYIASLQQLWFIEMRETHLVQDTSILLASIEGRSVSTRVFARSTTVATARRLTGCKRRS